MFDLHFSNRVLEIPKLIITSVTQLTTRNTLAFEQRRCSWETYVNDYVMIMNRLVSSQKDMDLLLKHGIIENKLGNTIEVSSCVNKLANRVIMKPNDFYFASLWEELNVFSTSPWNTWKANLKQNYFSTPWAIVSVIAACLLIVLTIIQAVCSVLSVTTNN
ncbi:hypothetical protein TorRG33x02_241400 [Trema orientale]|uniref:Uncharacterized protein n=1 Tax=Trema orientale TaxID=63057 RepID=A0A2P5DUJ3_TREOI|nr:hypothetical protein TorRG33x02_241400 [Trema orientale]